MKYQIKKDAFLLLSDETIFWGKSEGQTGSFFGEVCFNTGMTGYQEVFTDPSYFGQIVVMANAHIGNYGVQADESESDGVKVSGIVCRNFSTDYSRERATEGLSSFLERYNTPVISGVDTRQLVAHIRDNGAMNAVISTEIDKLPKLKEELKKHQSMKGMELASKVSTPQPYFFGDPLSEYKVAVLDFGVKRSILKNLANRGAYLQVFPYNTSFEELKKWNADGYFLSNGPGDPEPLKGAIELARQIIDADMPLFGICLGHQIIGLACSVETYKMHNGHRGINHPVKNLITGKGEITSQNHGFAVRKDQVENHKYLEITHLHLNDSTVAGMRLKGKKVFSVQYHPEAGPGPNDTLYLFDDFIENIKNHRKNKANR